MQEDLIMEKKGNRPVQPFAKGAGSDKKNQDVPNPKFYSRGGRRREPAGGTFPAKSEASRKPVPQRNKTVDKRPRARGYYYSGAVDGNESSRVTAEEAEPGSVLVQGSKKQSLNHLLNFHFEPRDTHWRSGTGTVSYKGGNRLVSTYKHKYNKEQFLQANCQFIVKVGRDYGLYMNDPDALVDWDLVEQININVLEYPSCPICLYPPVAAKMTRCGHIYCWSCILHYLALSDKAWRKCPICYESIHKRDLKSVVAIPHTQFNTSEEITFTLMKKLRGSLKVCPIDETHQENLFPQMTEAGSAAMHSKFLLAGKDEVVNIIRRERTELQLQLVEDEECPEKCFIDQALQLLTERERLILSDGSPKEANSELPDALVNDDKVASNEEKNEDCSAKGMGCLKRMESTSSEESDMNITVEDLDISAASNSQILSKYFYFYQASDGQHIYLHSLNIRMLVHTYGSLENCPKRITGKIIEKESGSMTEELRKRLRYLQHLPITCPFEVAEIQLKPPIVALPTITAFRDQIEMRRKRRRRREKEEKRREKRIEEEENRKIGRFHSANIRIESHLQFPEFKPEMTEAAGLDDGHSSPTSDRSLSPVSGISSNTPISGSLTKENEYSGLSFAKMLSSSRPRATSGSEVKPAAISMAAVPVKVINVTGSRAKPLFVKKLNPNDSEPEPEEYVPVPSFNRSFGDAIAIALEKAALANDCDNNGGTQQGSKKKKKNRQKVLFATSMTFSGN